MAAWAEKYPGTWPTNFEADAYIGLQMLFAAIDAADSVAPEDIAAALSVAKVDTILGPLEMRTADHQAIRGNYFGQVLEVDGVLRPVIQLDIPASVSMPEADPACVL